MTVSLDLAYWLGLIVSVVLPALVGLVTNSSVSSGTKAVLHLFLSAVLGFVTEWSQASGSFSIGTALVLWGVSFGIGVLTHFGLLKPTTVSGKLQAVGSGV